MAKYIALIIVIILSTVAVSVAVAVPLANQNPAAAVPVQDSGYMYTLKSNENNFTEKLGLAKTLNAFFLACQAVIFLMKLHQSEKISPRANFENSLGAPSRKKRYNIICFFF